MKLPKSHPLIALLSLTLGLGWSHSIQAQTGKAKTAASKTSSFLWEPKSTEPKTPEPKTPGEKLERLKARHKKAFDELSKLLRDLPEKPEQLGSKELLTQIEAQDKEMKSVQADCKTIRTELTASWESIKEGNTFTDDQKKELLASANELDKNCYELSVTVDLAVQQLSKALTTVANWKKTHSSYLSLQGPEKAAEQVKSKVDAYIAEFTPKEKTEIESAGGAASAPVEKNSSLE